ncbi:MAG: hypothetical protein AAGG48_30415 [Planctomycetota bacterium]
MRISRRKFTAAAVTLVALLPTGCSTLSPEQLKSQSLTKPAKPENSSFLDKLPWSNNEEEKVQPYPNPVKVASTWTADTLVQTGRTPTRGFGGRIFFYDEKSRPVPVDGTLVVHGFDDTATEEKHAVKRFEFTPDQFTRHFSQTDLGASYSIWIPWDAIGGPQKRISLVTSFKTEEGKFVQGIPATMVLPGVSEETEEEKTAAKFADQYLAHLEAAKSGNPSRSGLTTTTIQRRQIITGDEQLPGIKLPGQQQPSQIATAGQTPSLDLKMSKRPRQPTILPASAQMPAER